MATLFLGEGNVSNDSLFNSHETKILTQFNEVTKEKENQSALLLRTKCKSSSSSRKKGVFLLYNNEWNVLNFI